MLWVADRKPCINNIQQHCGPLWDRAHLKWKCVLWSDRFTFQTVFRNNGMMMPMASWVSVTSVKAPFMLTGTCRFWSNKWCHPGNVFFRGIPAYFSKTIPRHILRVSEQWGFIVEVCVLDWPACSPDLSPTENVWCIMKQKSRISSKIEKEFHRQSMKS